MQVRYKLDLCGVKLKLNHWCEFSMAQRQGLVDQPCQTHGEIAAYREQLRQWVLAQTGEWPKDVTIAYPAPWQQTDIIPDAVQAKALELGHVLSLAQWQSLDS